MTEELSQTQQIGDTQSLGTSETPDESTTPIHLHHSRQSLPSSSLIPSSESFTCDTEIETQLISDLVMRSSSTLADADGADDSEMLGEFVFHPADDMLIMLWQIWKLN